MYLYHVLFVIYMVLIVKIIKNKKSYSWTLNDWWVAFSGQVSLRHNFALFLVDLSGRDHNTILPC
jgi:hypothetical protein